MSSYSSAWARSDDEGAIVSRFQMSGSVWRRERCSGRLVEPGVGRGTGQVVSKGQGERARTGPALIKEVAANKVGEVDKLCSGAVYKYGYVRSIRGEWAR